MIVDRWVETVEYVRIVHRGRLLVWIKSCCYIERYSPLDLFEPARGVIRILQQMTLQQKRGSKHKKIFHLLEHYLNKKTPEGVYARCVGVRKNYRYVERQWEVE